MGIPRQIGKYSILERIGRGSMGTVYKAEHPTLKRLVALRVIALEPEDFTEDLRGQFQDAARACAALIHSNIVATYDFNEEDGQPYLVSDFVEGEELGRMIARRDPMSVATRVDIMVQLCDALHHAHEQGVLHQDLKPDKILIQRNGYAKILDFGLAPLAMSTRLARSGAMLGSPRYWAPEQVDPRVRQTSPLSDQYSLASVFYELLAGRPPFDENDPIVLMDQIRRDEPPSLRERSPSLPADLVAIVERAMSKDPAARYPDLRAMESDLQKVLRGLGAGVDMPSGPGPAVVRSHPSQPPPVVAPYAPVDPRDRSDPAQTREAEMAEESRHAMERVRSVAEAFGVDRRAADLWDQAEKAHAAAKVVLDRGQFSAARERFDAAQDLYRQAEAYARRRSSAGRREVAAAEGPATRVAHPGAGSADSRNADLGEPATVMRKFDSGPAPVDVESRYGGAARGSVPPAGAIDARGGDAPTRAVAPPPAKPIPPAAKAGPSPARESLPRESPSSGSEARGPAARDSSPKHSTGWGYPSRDSHDRPGPSRDSHDRPGPSRDSMDRPGPSRDSMDRPGPSRDSADRHASSWGSSDRHEPSREPNPRHSAARNSPPPSKSGSASKILLALGMSAAAAFGGYLAFINAGPGEVEVAEAQIRMIDARSTAEKSEADRYAASLFQSGQRLEREGGEAKQRSDLAVALDRFVAAERDYAGAATEAQGVAQAARVGMEGARAKSLAARRQASQDGAERNARFAEAQAKEVEGDRLGAAEDFAGATKVYEGAAGLYAEALAEGSKDAQADADTAKKEMLAAKRGADRSTAQFREAEQEEARANTAYEANEFREAAAAFRASAALFVPPKNDWSAQVKKGRATAIAARDQALAAGADQSAAESFGKAKAKMADAEKLAGGSSLESAVARYKEATTLYQQARSQGAAEGRAEAEQARERMLAMKRRADPLLPQFDAAEDGEEQAEKLFNKSAYGDSAKRFREAEAAYGKAREGDPQATAGLDARMQAARKLAEDNQREAARADAQQHAPDLLRQADEARSGADRLAASRDFDSATAAYAKAASQYAEASDQSLVEGRARAEQARERMMSMKGRADSSAPEFARGRAEEDRAKSLYQSSDYRAATEAYRSAEAAYGGASGDQ